MTTEEIRIRQLTNQRLTAGAPMTTVVRDLCGVQAQFVSHAMHALRIRSAACSPSIRRSPAATARSATTTPIL